MPITNMGNYNITSTGMYHRRFHVTSNYSHKTYVAEKNRHNPNAWTCTCKGFLDAIRVGSDDKLCDHILEVIKQEKIVIPTISKQEYPVPEKPIPHVIACTNCGTTKYTKAGKKSSKQVYKCKSCHRRFISTEPGFERTKYTPEIITSSLNMVMSGMSYRKASEHINFSHNIQIPHNTILSWVSKFSKIIKVYVDTLRPITGDVWSADEAVIKVKNTKKMEGKGYIDWLWTAIDPKTRFILASMIATDSRTSLDAAKLLKMAKTIGTPNYLVTDSQIAYTKAKRMIIPNVSHIQTKSIRDGFTNMAIERYHNEIREKLKSCRGLGNDSSAAIFANMLWIHHNFIRPHMGLDGKTPAQQAGLVTGDVSAGKYHALIPMAASKDISENRKIAHKLGNYNDYVSVFVSDDVIKVEPKGWLESEQWKDIANILASIGFTWFFNSKVRSWVRFSKTPFEKKISFASQAPIVIK